jgi:pyruvate/2-oxoglutarate dehydrogenase complex dihydrolipoamide acyltransferase (E2) component
MTTAERERFHNLLLMAKESPFEGERTNALEAAERMAQRHDMTLEEAARSGGEGLQKPTDRQQDVPKPPSSFEQAEAEAAARERAFAESARFMRDMEDHARSDKARRDEALKAAYDRGLDAEERRRAKRAASRDKTVRKNSRRRNPLIHAQVLLKETQLPIKEIASICGIDVYTVAGLKLKMRQEAAG